QRQVEVGASGACRADRVAARLETVLHVPLEVVGPLPEHTALVGCRLPEAGIERGDEAMLPAEEAIAKGLQVVRGGCALQRLVELGAQAVDLSDCGHGGTGGCWAIRHGTKEQMPFVPWWWGRGDRV